ncbi:chemotaxis protein CheB [Kineococcus terrestris]|uniref:chemotaxis protein CheB n=1 Tax=Kineococcus terrestris TaxID=2044856 RepID=UPI0034DB7C98
MRTRDVVVVGASAGGVEALRALVAGLPEDLPAAVLVVLHVPPTGANALPAILDRSGPLPVRTARSGDALERGQVLVARPDRHLFVADGHVLLTAGPRENGHRPAVDVLFRSAARALGPRAVGVVLSGNLDDGAAGLLALRAAGGTGVVQEPADALYPGMPAAAIAAGEPEHVVPLADVAATVSRLVGQPVGDHPAGTDPLLREETDVARSAANPGAGDDHAGAPSGYTCPDCNGSLYRIEDHGMLRFRCRVGHAWSPESLRTQQSVSTEGALWMAVRSLEERAALHREMGRRARDAGHGLTAQRFSERAAENAAAALALHRLLAEPGDAADDEDGERDVRDAEVVR